jgi:transposase-like protein
VAGAGQQQRRARTATISAERAEIKQLNAEISRLRKDNEILKAATVLFAKELDPSNR